MKNRTTVVREINAEGLGWGCFKANRYGLRIAGDRDSAVATVFHRTSSATSRGVITHADLQTRAERLGTLDTDANSTVSGGNIRASGIGLPVKRDRSDVNRCRWDQENDLAVISSYGAGEGLFDRDREAGSVERPGGTPSGSDACSETSPDACSDTNFESLGSVRSMRTGRVSRIQVGFDTEFVTRDTGREILSYQFAVLDPFDPDLLHEIVICPMGQSCLGLGYCLGIVVREAGLHCLGDDAWDGTRGVSIRSLLPDDEAARLSAEIRGRVLSEHEVHDDPDSVSAFVRATGIDIEAKVRSAVRRGLARATQKVLSPHNLKLDLICHYGSADLTAFAEASYDPDLLLSVISASGGLMTERPVPLHVGTGVRRWIYPLSVGVRDTLAHAPAGGGSLASLGAVTGVEKISLPGDYISRMDDLLADDPGLFLDYGVNDALVTLAYATRVGGVDQSLSMTLPSGAARAVSDRLREFFGCGDKADLDLVWRGVVRDTESGLCVDEDDDGDLAFYRKDGLVPVSGPGEQVMTAWSRAYHGGYNACPGVGWFGGTTYDVDACGAYPTAMACVRDIDWSDPIATIFTKQELSLDLVSDFDVPFVGWVTFEFPEDVKFPTIPIRVDGSPVFVSESTTGVWACGPEIVAALHLGARVWCEVGYLCRVLRFNGEDSRSLAYGMQGLVDDRAAAASVYGKKSVEALVLKTGAASVYGKMAQSVAGRRGWSSRDQDMEDLTGSALTSPYHAAMTTALVRAQLLLAMNAVDDAGHRVISVTTDGFITDMGIESIRDLPLYGLRDILGAGRERLVGDTTIWELKHTQSEVLSVTTRGNVGRDESGVLAHASLVTPDGIARDSAEDRAWFWDTCISRTGRINFTSAEFPSFRALSRSDDKRQDFIVKVLEKSRHLDFDLKRRPDLSTMRREQVTDSHGEVFEVATFDTRPWRTVDELTRGRTFGDLVRQRHGCIRTGDQWLDWGVRFRSSSRDGVRIGSVLEKVLMSVVVHHRQGVIDIPTLSSKKIPQSAKVEWLSQWGCGEFTKTKWDNARRRDRANNAFAVTDVAPLIEAMKDLPIEGTPTKSQVDEVLRQCIDRVAGSMPVDVEPDTD